MISNLSNLKVYYGWAVLNKIRKKPALSVIFENEFSFSDRKEITIKRLQTTCYVRTQTVAEAEDGKNQNRILTEYSTLLFDKDFKGDIEKLLENNYQADVNNVDEDKLHEIREALKKGFKNAYKGL